MLSAGDFRDLVSGERRDLFAKFLRPLLHVGSWFYGAAVRFRNRRYDLQRVPIHRVNALVICVGNLTVGGTGKTPMVAYLARWFRERNVRVALVSRGYGAGEGSQNDEARELSEKLRGIQHVQNSDRVAAAKLTIAEHATQLIVMDDGFQHRRLARDLDIVLIDALEPFGYEHVLPRGLLREPVEGLRRAHVVGLSRADLVTPERREELRERVARISPSADWIELAHAPTHLQANNQQNSIEVLNGRHVLGFCGLGNPAGFRMTLHSCGANVIDFREFPDHHVYTDGDLDSLRGWIREQQPDFVICTHKDFVKLQLEELEGVPLRALIVDLQILRGAEELDGWLNKLLSDVADKKINR